MGVWKKIYVCNDDDIPTPVVIGVDFMKEILMAINPETKEICYNFFDSYVRIGTQTIQIIGSGQSLNFSNLCCNINRLSEEQNVKTIINKSNEKILIDEFGQNTKELKILESYPICNIGGRKLPHLKVFVNNEPVLALWDTGSCLTFCKESTARKVGLEIEPLKTFLNVTAANGTPLIILGDALAHFKFGQINLWARVYISKSEDCPAQLVIGYDLMNKLSSIGYDTGLTCENIKVGPENLPIILAGVIDSAEAPSYKLYTTEDTILQPMADHMIPATTMCRMPSNWEFIVEEDPETTDSFKVDTDFEDEYGFWGAATPHYRIGKTYVNFDDENNVCVRIMNCAHAPIFFPKNTHIAHIEFVRDSSNPESYTNFVCSVAKKQEDIVKDNNQEKIKNENVVMWNGSPIDASPELDIFEKLPPEPETGFLSDEEFLLSKINREGSCLNEIQWETLLAIIFKHKESFVLRDGLIGTYNGPLVHEINLKPNVKPVVSKPRRYPPAIKEEMKRQDLDQLRQ
jgi:hypothetical protein